MAEGFLSGLLGTIMENLKSLILEEVSLAWSYQTELKILKSTLSTIQAVLHDAEQQEIRSAAMRNWLIKLKDAAYDADDFLDAYKTDVLSQKLKGQFSTLNSFVFRFGFGNRIKEIQERLDGIAAERSKFHLKDAMVVEEPLDSVQRHQTHSFVIESGIYGREDDKRNLLKLLMDDHGPEIRSVIPIVGMGGIGKTTVAQLVYNDKKVEDHFDLRMWVCFSERFDQARLLQAIIESGTGNKCDIYYAHLIHKLRQMLLDKKFLLVLDNVWSEDHEMWDGFKQLIFRCGVMGSKVVVTTRSAKVAIILGSVNPYHLGVLSDDDCWSLFEQRAFGTSTEKKPILVHIGKEIVKKCGGVPLAAKALGSMMRFKNDVKQWYFIKASEIWNLPDDENVPILPALKLSYSHLSPHLKQCFAYCSIFPKGYVIKKDKLILLWMANGFIPTKQKMTIEDIGNEIFSDLLMRSFFQGVEQADDGTVTKCKMHDLVSDLAQHITRNESFIIQRDMKNVDIEMARHLCCDTRQSLRIPLGSYRARSLRTFLLLSIKARYLSSRVPPDITNFKCLRVLSLSRACIHELPISIENLKHIRYLDLSYTNISTLPESLDNLQNLQTLLLKYCALLCKLPKRLGNIINIRHINIKGCTSLTQMPPQIGRLTQLQTLTNYIVGEKEGSRIGELQCLNLRGELHIIELQNVPNGTDARDANLINKQDIQSLGLSWKEDDRAKSVNDHEEALEALQPNQNLKGLYLQNYKGREVPSWMKSPFILNLVEISLVKCRNIKKLPQLGKLPCLKILCIKGIESLQYIDSDLYGDDISTGIPFPSLEKLSLIKLPNLEGWQNQERRENFPRLSKLTISKCFKLTNLPYILSLQHLVLEDCNEELLLSLERKFPSLLSLQISGFRVMESLPIGMLEKFRQLRSFKIKDCPRVQHLSRELEQLPVPDEGVSIWNCDDLSSISENTWLEHDSITDCFSQLSH